MISIGAVIVIAADIVIIVTNITTIIIVSALAGVAVIPRPPDSPTRTDVPERQRGLRDALSSSQ
eukprot:1998399-Pyramimonas_sp.AAC.1